MTTADEFIGLTKSKAQDTAEFKNFIFRMIRKDKEDYFPYPTDYCATRICVEIDNGLVTKATIQ